MKKIFLVCLFCFLIFAKITYSAFVEINIAESLKGNLSSLSYDNSSNIVRFLTEFYNTGSVGYRARIKIEIFNESKMVFAGWSKEKILMPGDKKSFDTYWYADQGKYSAKIKTYFGNEVQDYLKFDIAVGKNDEIEDVFEIKNFRTYDNYIIFDIKSKRDVKNIVVIPYEYTYGWIFEQEKIDSIPENSSKTVVVNYYPTVWNQSNIKLVVTSDRGKYYSEETFEMEKIGGLTGLFYHIIDALRVWLS